MIHVDADFPGGNIRVLSIEGDELHLAQDLRDTEGHWFWWCCRVTGAGGTYLRVQLHDDFLLTSAGPAVSFDGGQHWQWGQAENVHEHGFSLQVPPGVTDLRLAVSLPYTDADWQRTLADLGSAAPQAHLLCLSPKQRPVYRYRLPARTPRLRMLLVARHHACEAMASYVMDGFLRFAALGSDPALEGLRQFVDIDFVPFVDRDGVEDGDQGKARRPHDHNRDYRPPGEASLYPEVQALRDWVIAEESAAPPLRMALDLHCPWIRDGQNDTVFLVGAREPEQVARQRQWLGHWIAEQRGALRMREDSFFPWGREWNTATGPATSCSRWLRERPGMWLSSTVEVSYALHHTQRITAETARELGADLLRACSAFLRSETDRSEH